MVIEELRSQGFVIHKGSMQFKVVWSNFKNRRGGFSRGEVYRYIRTLINEHAPGFARVIRAHFELNPEPQAETEVAVLTPAARTAMLNDPAPLIAMDIETDSSSSSSGEDDYPFIRRRALIRTPSVLDGAQIEKPFLLSAQAEPPTSSQVERLSLPSSQVVKFPEVQRVVDRIKDLPQSQVEKLAYDLSSLIERGADSFDKIMAVSDMASPNAAAEIASIVYDRDDLASLIRRSCDEETSRKAKYEAMTECPICMEKVERLHAASFTCNHKVCTACLDNTILATLKSNAAIVKCPCCRPGDDRADAPEAACVPKKAWQLIDPWLYLIATRAESAESTSHNLALERFQRSKQILFFAGEDQHYEGDKFRSCPACKTVTSALFQHGSIARCLNPNCAVLFCTRCESLSHMGSTCEQAMDLQRAKVDTATENTVAKTSKCCPNPSCKTPITHYHKHGCHHVTCRCRTTFCYLCLSRSCSCGIWCDDKCGCPRCAECKPGVPCRLCTGCDSCEAIY